MLDLDNTISVPSAQLCHSVNFYHFPHRHTRQWNTLSIHLEIHTNHQCRYYYL